MNLTTILPLLLAGAWLAPLLSFTLIVFFGAKMGKGGRGAGYVATGAILFAFLLSVVGLGLWLVEYPLSSADHHPAEASSHSEHRTDDHSLTQASSPFPAGSDEGFPTFPIADNAAMQEESGEQAGAATSSPSSSEHAAGDAHPVNDPPPTISGDWYALTVFNELRVTIGYHIDALTLAMFVMVTLIASCIHIYSFGYMHEEEHEVTDSQVMLNGLPLRRRGRFHRFYQYLSLFCFSMLGLVIAGNVAMVFMFWELVGICSYFLIGFYIERNSASNAANKAFIVNRVGDFGMIIGLMALWGSLGTFSFADSKGENGEVRPGIFSQVRSAENHYALRVPAGMVRSARGKELTEIYARHTSAEERAGVLQAAEKEWAADGAGYGLLVLAGLGIFCGCVGKSAQFPLHVWLPDAMEGPTPVSALIHAATMVAAGVYLTARIYPIFTPEVLMVIAIIGSITLLLAASIALTATDIKRVLAYSTVSQLGYMMLSLGMGGWIAGTLHLFTHAFFKSLLFLCSGSVIHAVGTNDMKSMGGLRRPLPYTAYTMLVGCLAIAGAGIPFLIGLSGYYSKDAILAQGLIFKSANPLHGLLFYVAIVGAAMTAFYMFRLWYMTFAGEPRDLHHYEHAHESPPSMVYPLVILATLSVIAAWNIPFTNWGLTALIEQAQPAGVSAGQSGGFFWKSAVIPPEHLGHASDVHFSATIVAFFMALAGFALATGFYGLKVIHPEEVRRGFAPLYNLFYHKWWFDELYDFLFVRPCLRIARFTAECDRRVLDWLADSSAWLMTSFARLQNLFDQKILDRSIDLFADGTFTLARRLRSLQTGSIRDYVLYLATGAVALFVLLSMYWNYTIAH